MSGFYVLKSNSITISARDPKSDQLYLLMGEIKENGEIIELESFGYKDFTVDNIGIQAYLFRSFKSD